jgi:pyridoxamine 5'-phosphate oxidase-like protein
MNLSEGLALVARYGASEHWLATLTTLRTTGDPSVSVVNAGVVAHPVTGETVLGFVARGRTAKLANLRHRARAALLFRHGWEWVAAHGSTELAGPGDPLDGMPAERLPRLLRDIYLAAGGRHPDMSEYDRVMAVERRTAVLMRPDRFTTNPPGTEHKETR